MNAAAQCQNKIDQPDSIHCVNSNDASPRGKILSKENQESLSSRNDFSAITYCILAMPVVLIELTTSICVNELVTKTRSFNFGGVLITFCYANIFWFFARPFSFELPDSLCRLRVQTVSKKTCEIGHV